MGYQLASYTDEFGTAHSAAYLRVTSVEVQHKAKTAVVEFEIYSSAAAATDGASQPLKRDGYAFTDTASSSSSSSSSSTSTTTASSSSSTLYTSNFATTLGTDPTGTQPTDVNDILQCQAYLALRNHPTLTTLLSGATVA